MKGLDKDRITTNHTGFTLIYSRTKERIFSLLSFCSSYLKIRTGIKW